MFRNATLSVFVFFTTTENKNYPGKEIDTKVSSYPSRFYDTTVDFLEQCKALFLICTIEIFNYKKYLKKIL